MSRFRVWHPLLVLLALLGFYFQLTFALVCGGLIAGYLSASGQRRTVVIEYLKADAGGRSSRSKEGSVTTSAP